MKNFQKNWVRHLLQWGTLIAIIVVLTKIFGNETADPEAYCPFGGIQTLATYLVAGSMACSMTATQIMMGVFLAIGVILFSKLFCSYVCPLGVVSEYLIKLRKSLKLPEIKIEPKSIIDRLLRVFKYIILYWIFYSTVSSSELFCKNFDPYYAFATGFKGELTMWMAIISIALFILGNMFIKMFWCKYLCPLGAISNIFKYAITFTILVVLYIALGFTGIEIHWTYLLAAATILGWLWEIIYMESKVAPMLKVVRDTEKCNNCGICSKKCPYSIDVDKTKVVKHIDCNLCGECIASCNKDALTFGGKSYFRWTPAILTVVLFFAALFIGKTIELPTIDLKWGDEAKHENLEKIRVEGMRSVKCFGSSSAFAAKLKRINGIYGVATYVKHAYVDIYFQSDEITEEQIRKEIFVPSKFKINNPDQSVEQIKVITIYTEYMHDRMDPNYLGLQFRNSEKEYYGLETEYNCPIIVRLYMGINEPIDERFIKSMVEMKELEMPVHGGGTRTIKVNYEYVGMESGQIDTISRLEFIKRMFTPFSVEFKNTEEWIDKSPTTYQILYPGLDKPIISRNLPFLSNYLSQQKGLIKVETVVTEDGEYAINITFSSEITDPDTILNLLNSPKWTIKNREGIIEEVDAKLPFETKGQII